MSSNNYLAEPITTVNPVVRVEDLLSATWNELTATSGGPPNDGAVPQGNRDGTWVWSSVAGYFRVNEDGTPMLTEDGRLRITES